MRTILNAPAADPLADLCEQLIAEGMALNVAPDALLAATAEAFDFLLVRAPVRST